jgi:hypothetical protein
MINLQTYTVNSRVTALQAQALANDFLSDSLPDRFTANLAEWVGDQWRISVILTYPQIGSLGEVGELQLDAETGRIIGHTPLDRIKQMGMELYTANQDAIELITC